MQKCQQKIHRNYCYELKWLNGDYSCGKLGVIKDEHGRLLCLHHYNKMVNKRIKIKLNKLIEQARRGI